MLRLYWTQLMATGVRGYGRVAQELKWALEKTNTYMLGPQEFGWDFKVLVSTPKAWYHRGDLEKELDVIYHTMYDADLLPEEWVECLNLVGAVWVPSQWSKRVFQRSGVTSEIFVSGYGVDDEVIYYTLPQPYRECPDSLMREHEMAAGGEIEIRAPEGWLEKNLGIKVFNGLVEASKDALAAPSRDKPFVFLSIATSVFDRKGSASSIRAFRELDAPNAILVLKFNTGMGVTVKGDDRIRSLVADYSTMEYINLIQRSHCVVYPSSGEGFGLMPLEAMAVGRPVILTDYSGMTEYIDDRYCYPVPIEGVQRSELYNRVYNADGSWAMVDENGLRDQMQHVYDDYEAATEKGKAASEHVLSEWTWRQAGERAHRILENLKYRYRRI